MYAVQGLIPPWSREVFVTAYINNHVGYYHMHIHDIRQHHEASKFRSRRQSEVWNINLCPIYRTDKPQQAKAMMSITA